MKKILKKMVSFVMAVAIILTGIQLFPAEVKASSSTNKLPITCYTLNGKVDTYTTQKCNTYSGYIASGDLCKILNIYPSDNSVRVEYPTTKGKKTAYAKVGSFFSNVNFSTTVGKTGKQLTAYRRSTGTATVGTVYASDSCIITGTANGRTQLIFPVSGGYKCGWVNGTYNFNTSTTTTTTTTVANIANGKYAIKTALNTAMALDVNNNSSANGTNIQIYKYSGNNAQIFTIESLGNGYYRIIHTASGKVLDVAGGVAGHVNLQLYQWNGSNAQKFRFIDAGSGYYYIQNALGYYVDVYGGVAENHRNVWMYTGNKSTAQKWKLTQYSTGTTTTTSASISNGKYAIKTALNTAMALDVHNNSSANGANIQIYQYSNGNKAQIFTIESLGNGYYRIIHTASGKVLDVAGGVAGHVNLQLYQWNGSNAQKFRFIDAGSGYYYIQNALGYYVDVYGGVAQNHRNVWMYTGNKSTAQKWKLTAYSSSNNSTTNTTLTNALYKINTSSTKISCGFDGYKTTSGRHEGIDFAYGYGKNVYSLTDGVITKVTYGYNGSNGLSTIAIYNQATNKTIVYLHSAPVSGLKVGQTISKGTHIATEAWRGCSNSSKTHTHVEVRNGKKTSAAKSLNDYTLENPNPTSFWNSLGYTVK